MLGPRDPRTPLEPDAQPDDGGGSESGIRQWIVSVVIAALLVAAGVGVATRLPVLSLGPVTTPSSSAGPQAPTASPGRNGAPNPTPGTSPSTGPTYVVGVGSPPGQATGFDDFFPRSLIVARGSVVTFRITGLHTATLLTAGATAIGDRVPNPRVTSPAGCGSPDQPCRWDGSASLSLGPGMLGTPATLVVRIVAPAGSYLLHSRLQPLMIASLQVVDPGSPDISTPDDIATTIAEQIATDVPTSIPASAYGGLAGLDISYPDCKRGLPTSSPGSLVVVGVNGGKMFQPNPCLAKQYAWARSMGAPALYINANAAYGATAWHGATGPAGTCPPGGTACRGYNYGYNAARDAWQYASRQLGPPNLPNIWWLDVETSNTWFTPQLGANRQVIQGALDFLGKPGQFGAPSMGYTVGIYSTNLQWTRIVGPDYRPGVPAWYATVVKTPTAARNWCTSPFDNPWGFTGGRVWLVQYRPGGRDTNVGCP